ncbi:hypothetical protein HYH03_011755 [Edaphochlamys debaryana]|uniref:Proteasome activator Blm10 mid region domain-containing protein n=1 Tax=Edaphochlamys debaryana TaxID=47281 RepID=A0A836BUP8_9CHLO|nr:hypothetical protein HYH03_011755 [Edaphochlamys debaryana]|eukprot:KAG2489806.1 hypothetical protein HYH03_011755 [Edaphochlamys debaryana]
MAPRIWQTWLPPELAQGVLNDEPKRFSALSACAVADFEAASASTDPNRWQCAITWISHINTFVGLHQDYEPEAVVALTQALWRGVVESWRDLEAQYRMADCLLKLLRAHKVQLRRARLVLPWRPLFASMQRLHGTHLPKLEGVGLIAARGQTLARLVAKARRHFEPAALGEVWAELAPAVLAAGHRPAEAYEALGYLQLFAPTHSLCACDWGSVNRWVREWMDAWGRMANSSAWDSLWLGLVSRAAKHDWRGVIHWQPHLPHLFATLCAMFDVPVGSARGLGEMVGRGPAVRGGSMFLEQMGYGPFHAARLAVSLLRCTAASASAATAASAASHLEHLTGLLEQYFHPSNTGKWCRELSTLLKHLAKAAVKQLQRQQPRQQQQQGAEAGGAQAGVATASDELDEYEEYGNASGSGSGSGQPAPVSGGDGGRPWASELREPELQRLAACCIKLAARGQFSKDEGLGSVSIRALAQLAPIAPARVLPLALERFRTALATATATHQLAAATTTLALCVRPLLLAAGAGAGAAGLGGEMGEGEEGDKETAAQMVSEALMAALPGLDANDEPKTNAVLQLYVAVLSALPRLRGAGEDEAEDEAAAREEEEEHAFLRAAAKAAPATLAPQAGAGGGKGLVLSIYVAEWADEVLERCLALLSNLDSGPGQRGTDLAGGGGRAGGARSTSSFLVGGRSLFGPLWQLLLHSARPSVRRALVQRLAAWALGGTHPGVAAEVAIIAANAAAAAPRETLRRLILPLLARVEAEAAELQRLAPGAGEGAEGASAPAPPPPSTAAEATLRYQLALLSEALAQLHSDLVLAPGLHGELGAALGPPPVPGSPPSPLPPGSLGTRVLALADALSGVNSAPLQAEAATLGGMVSMVMARFWMEPHLPWRRPPLGPALLPVLPGAGVEAWVDKFGTGYGPPRWRSPDPSHVVLSSRLLAQRLVACAQRLRGAAEAGAAGAPADSAARLRLREQLFWVRGMLSYSLSMLRDFEFGAEGDAPAPPGQAAPVSLAVVGALGLTVGEAGTREAVAEAMAAVCSALRSASDPELLDAAVRSASALLASGSAEYMAATSDERQQRSSSHSFCDPPAAARLMAPGTPWRKRLPPWVVGARLFNSLTARAGAAAFRGWATTARPQLTRPEQFPPSYLALTRSVALLAQHQNQALARQAAGVVDVVLKRFPALAPPLLPIYLAAIADVPYAAPPPGASLAAPPPPAFFEALREAAFAVAPSPAPAPAADASAPAAASTAAAAAAPGTGADQEGAKEGAQAPQAQAPPGPQAQAPRQRSDAERDGLVLGSVNAIVVNLNFWRLIFRSPPWLAASVHAILAGRAHNASIPQRSLGDFLLHWGGRCVHPPALSYAPSASSPAAADPSSPSLADPYGSLVSGLLELARPGGMARRGAPFRYSVIANVLLALLAPHRLDEAAGGAFGGSAARGGGGVGDVAMAEGGAVVAAGGGGAGGGGAGVAGALLRHMLGLLESDAPQLRQLGMSGTFLPLCALLQYGDPAPELLVVLKDTIAADPAPAPTPTPTPTPTAPAAPAAEAGPSAPGAAGAAASAPPAAASPIGPGGGWGGRLMSALVLGHTELDAAESMKDKRGAGMLAMQQRLLNMTFEEMAGALAAVALERLAGWPNDGMAAPPALAEGAFVVKHARFVQLMAAAAPAEVLAALRPSLEALTAPERLATAANSTEKSELAAAAEALAGLLAAGAPWAPAVTAAAAGGGEGGGWAVAAMGRALRSTSLEMADSWAVSYRFAVRGLLDALIPTRLYPAAPPTPDGAVPPAPLAAPGLVGDPAATSAALAELLALTVPSAAAAAAAVGPAAASAGDAAAAAGVAAAAAVAAEAAGGGGGLPRQLKRLRCVGQAVRELCSLEPQGPLPLPVRLFWSGALSELSGLTSSPDSLPLREQLRGPLADAVAYWGAAEGLLDALPPLPANTPTAGNGNGRNGNGRGNGNGTNGGEGDLVHVSAGPSGASTPAEMELGEGEEGPVLLLHGAPVRGASVPHLQRRARALALALAAGFNAAAVAVQEARGAGPPAGPSPAPASPEPGAAGAGSAAGTGVIVGVGSVTSGGGASNAESDAVMVEAADAASLSASGSPGAAGALPSASSPASAPGSSAAQAPGFSGPSALAGSLPVCRLGVGLEALVLAASRHRSPALRELVVGMLPGLLRMQDVAGPDLQKFARELQLTLLVVRCLSLNTHAADGAAAATAGGGGASGARMVAAALEAAATASVVDVPWSARSAALAYLQTLWFRHVPLLSQEQLGRLQELVEARLPDPKAEVRALAAATLSGLLRGASPAEAEATRARVLARANDLFGGGGRRGNRRAAAAATANESTAAAAGSTAPAQLQLEKQGCVAGLSALLMSQPYDVAPWVPAVLLALVRAAGGGERDGGVRAEAGRALGEFRRTHEAEALEELRGAMGADDWDSFTQATGTASYFV